MDELVLSLTCCEIDDKEKQKKIEGMKLCMSSIGIERSGTCEKGAGAHAKRNFNVCDLIGMFFSSICYK